MSRTKEKGIDKWIGIKPGVWGWSPQLADDPGMAKVPSAASAPWQCHRLVSYISLTEGRWLDLDGNKDSEQHEEEAKEINEEQDSMGNNKDDKALKNDDALLRFKFQVELLELPVPVDHDKLDVMVLTFILSS